MKNKNRIALLIMFVLACSATAVYGWGVWGHQHINKAAILALPKEMGMFFYNHSDFVVEESVVPDIRKYTINDKAEPNRHYIDLEGFNYKSPETMPQTMKDAVALFGNDTVQKYGILPWYIQDMMDKLTTAFKQKNKTEILFLAADLGHYIGDAHMPLHTSINHDGQFTDQKGIHAFWESQLPEMFGDNYNLYTGEAHYIDNVTKATWDLIADTHRLADTLLLADKKVRSMLPPDSLYSKDVNGNTIKNKYGQPVRSHLYAAKYHEMLNGMVEAQLRKAILATASFWYTAWVNAGKPDLSNLDPESLTKRNEKYYKKDLKLWKKGKIEGFRAYEY